jgi:hypothetical protein
MNTITLQRVKFMPRQLSPGVLYVCEQFAVAGHLCACGCGNKVMTPLGPVEWSFSERAGRPSLWPSIGSWQLPCRSHYVINEGRILWAGQWSEEQILAGRHAEQQRRQVYYGEAAPEPGFWRRLWALLRQLVGR